jgi:hypothetical protein
VDEERLVQPAPEVLEGDDDVPRQPASARDPFVPEPGPRPGEERAFRWLMWAWIPVGVIVALILIELLG